MTGTTEIGDCAWRVCSWAAQQLNAADGPWSCDARWQHAIAWCGDCQPSHNASQLAGMARVKTIAMSMRAMANRVERTGSIVGQCPRQVKRRLALLSLRPPVCTTS